MENILIKPRNLDEFTFIQEFLKRTHLRSEVLEREEMEDIDDYNKAMKRIEQGKAAFYSLNDVKSKFKISN